MAVTEWGVIHFRGLAEDDKPTGKDGDRFVETDTGKVYVKQEASWAEESADGLTLTVAETEVFNGTSPNAWTDLDLSAVVGSNCALVLVKIRIPLATQSIAVRKNGDTDEFWNSNGDKAGGCALMDCSYSYHRVLLVATDSSGIIEWRAQGTQANTTIDVMAFIM